MQNVQFYRQQPNGNHMSAQHYSIEYREGGTCVDPLVALGIFMYPKENKNGRIILITKIFAMLKFQG